MKVPGKCPWCGAPYIRHTGKEMNVVLGMIYYGCGTIVTVYPQYVCVATPCNKEVQQWISHEEFHDIACKESV